MLRLRKRNETRELPQESGFIGHQLAAVPFVLRSAPLWGRLFLWLFQHPRVNVSLTGHICAQITLSLEYFAIIWLLVTTSCLCPRSSPWVMLFLFTFLPRVSRFGNKKKSFLRISAVTLNSSLCLLYPSYVLPSPKIVHLFTTVKIIHLQNRVHLITHLLAKREWQAAHCYPNEKNAVCPL